MCVTILGSRGFISSWFKYLCWVDFAQMKSRGPGFFPLLQVDTVFPHTFCWRECCPYTQPPRERSVDSLHVDKFQNSCSVLSYPILSYPIRLYSSLYQSLSKYHTVLVTVIDYFVLKSETVGAAFTFVCTGKHASAGLSPWVILPVWRLHFQPLFFSLKLFQLWVFCGYIWF